MSGGGPAPGPKIVDWVRRHAQELSDGARKWNLFHAWFGSAVGRAIGQEYAAEHPTDDVFVDTPIGVIAGKLKLPSAGTEPFKRPDIYNATTGKVYEIKAYPNQILAEEEAMQYSAWLRAVGAPASPGVGDGSTTSGRLRIWGMSVTYEQVGPGAIVYEYDASALRQLFLAGATAAALARGGGRVPVGAH